MHRSILLAIHRVGPYHHIRFEAAAERCSLHVLETRPNSVEYPWDFEAPGSYTLERLTGHSHPEFDPDHACLDRQFHDLLERLQPSVVVCVGWADRAYQRLLLACQHRALPAVIVSDSRERDEPRHSIKEWIKAQLLRGYSAALVAGSESQAYLEQLGFPAERVYAPWDVVDNDTFAPAVGGLPTSVLPHFLCVSRLVEKKNHRGLVEAYGLYQQLGGRWGLRLIGSGPLASDIRAQIAALPAPQKVDLLPFQQLPQLADLYREASAFVLASTSDQWGLVVNEAMAAGLPCLVSTACGCCRDLITHACTGWQFDPFDHTALAQLFLQAERQLPQDRTAMVLAARKRLDSYTPIAFAEGLLAATSCAQHSPRRSKRAAWMSRLLTVLT